MCAGCQTARDELHTLAGFGWITAGLGCDTFSCLFFLDGWSSPLSGGLINDGGMNCTTSG